MVSSLPAAVAAGGWARIRVEVLGSLTGTPAQNEQNLRFGQLQGVRAVIEPADLAGAGAAYARMMSGEARFRMVLSV